MITVTLIPSLVLPPKMVLGPNKSEGSNLLSSIVTCNGLNGTKAFTSLAKAVLLIRMRKIDAEMKRVFNLRISNLQDCALC